MSLGSGEHSLVDVAASLLPSGKIVYETLWVEALETGRYRLVKTPLVAQGLAVDDELEVNPADKSFRVIKRGGNLTVQLFVRPALGKDVFDQLLPAVERLGGNLDAHTDSIAGFCLPVSAGFPAIERVFLDFVDGRTDAAWMFANVYGEDGRPLNWW